MGYISFTYRVIALAQSIEYSLKGMYKSNYYDTLNPTSVIPPTQSAR